ncbi:Crp/Fnr family transcriptional regulator [Marivirga salinae]|uniref:Crp/Fnr family transcriptional regulator n=1 Tax=Marivirga salinarum TaxID=3059078 RepID=A0AA49GDE9_9BACT|nr:Crp/Fnr family transcriptional regulator [Marivirga sp. BDSF4-3]WKK78108.1 Crp/Fnr family transcriptional regulator [Marivirga sp. BDSF4-3]
MYQQLHQSIAQFIDTTEEEKNFLERAFIYKKVPKKVRLVDYGQVSNELYFINKGIIRLFYPKDGEEITGYLFKENLFSSSYDSFLTQTPSLQILETLEDCELLVITKDSLNQLYEQMPAMHIFTRKMAEQRFINAQRILSSFILDSPEERYLKFETANKDLLQRVPQHYIASFLGITPVSLSRIRKRLMDKED